MKTFVFDADGVICVGPSFTESLEREHQIPRATTAPFFAGPFPDCVRGVRDLKAELAGFLPAWGWQRSVDELLAFWFQREHVLCPEALGCVRELRRKGHGCVLGTNQEKYRAAYLAQEMGLAAVFDAIFPSCELGAAKPSREFFGQIQARLRQPPGNLCLIDDAERNVAAAWAAGWSAIHYRDVADLAQIEAAANS